VQDRIIGIIGGMGPKSTADFFLRIVDATYAQKDQDHLRIIIDNNPQIPDRSSAILHNGDSPLPELEKTLHNLERAGAELIAMPCNTAHFYYQELQRKTRIPIINMIAETAGYVSQNYPDIRNIGLLATTGTINTGIYHDTMKSMAMEVIAPDEEAQKLITKVIYGTYGIKAGCTGERLRAYLVTAAKALITQGAEAIVLGCSEICSVLKQDDLPVPLINSIQVLAEVSVANARAANNTFSKDRV